MLIDKKRVNYYIKLLELGYQPIVLCFSIADTQVKYHMDHSHDDKKISMNYFYFPISGETTHNNYENNIIVSLFFLIK
jgi:hypothetical protein